MNSSDKKFDKFFQVAFSLFLIFSLLLFSCNFSEQKKTTIETSENYSKVKINHSKGFVIKNYTNFTKLEVYNPWQGAKNISYEYVLSENKNNISSEFSNINYIKTPVERVVCLSTTHIALIDFVGNLQSIVGVSDKKLINNQELLQNIDDNKISEVGSEYNLNYEILVKLNPDVVFIYGVGSEALNSINKLQELNIQAVIIADYLENTPLAKAEWVKFIASFFNKIDLAEKKFSLIENEYNYYKQLSEKAKSKPTVMTGLPWKDTWFVGGGNSFAAKFISDAGGNYLWKNNQSHESFALNIEAVFEKSMDADIWINIGTANNRNDITNVDGRLKYISAVKNSMLFNNNAKQNIFGGNDYWESGIVNPHIILKDLISIFHPEILPNHKLVYYKRLLK